MLVENKSLTGKVGVLKLITGEEVIARISEDGYPAGRVTVKNPLAMVMMPSEDNQGMVAFAPWMLGVDEDTGITIDAAKIIALAPARADAASQYSQAVGEEIQATPRISPLQSNTGRRGGRGR
ncbi:hypothetical protein D3C87_733030 [compost metagenome]